MFPKPAPNTWAKAWPEDALYAGEMEKRTGVSWNAFKVNEAMAPKATLNTSADTFPLTAGRRHVMMESLVQMEAAQSVTAGRTAGDDATLANDWPARTTCALPVAGKRVAANDECVADKFTTTGSG